MIMIETQIIMIGKISNRKMNKKMRIVLLLIVCCVSCTLQAQQVTISVHDYDSLRYEIKSLQGQLEKQRKESLAKDTLIMQTQASVVNYQKDITTKETLIANLRSSVSLLRNDSNSLIQERLKVQSLQQQADENAAKLANGRLYFRYDNKLVQSSIQILQSIKTSSVKEKFSQTLELLRCYSDYSEQIKSVLTYAQEDSERKLRNRGDEYRARYQNEIKRTTYYTEIYAKKSANRWSIPYLDNIISVAEKSLQRHDPGHGNYIDFTVLIEML